MSDSVKGCFVAFDADLSNEVADAVISAIRQIRHVAAVSTHVARLEDWNARARVRVETAQAMREAWDAVMKGRE